MAASDHLHPEQFANYHTIDEPAELRRPVMNPGPKPGPITAAPSNGWEDALQANPGASISYPKDDTPEVSNKGISRNPDPQPGISALPDGIPPKDNPKVPAAGSLAPNWKALGTGEFDTGSQKENARNAKNEMMLPKDA